MATTPRDSRLRRGSCQHRGQTSTVLLGSQITRRPGWCRFTHFQRPKNLLGYDLLQTEVQLAPIPGISSPGSSPAFFAYLVLVPGAVVAVVGRGLELGDLICCPPCKLRLAQCTQRSTLLPEDLVARRWLSVLKHLPASKSGAASSKAPASGGGTS